MVGLAHVCAAGASGVEMIVACPQCQAKYRLDEQQFVGRREVTVRCNQCGARFPERIPESLSGPVAEKSEFPALPPGMNVSLAITDGPLKGKVFPITKPRVVLGRAGADIVVADQEISRQHCVLEVYGPTARLQDLGSTNGTWMDGERVESRELGHLSEFRIGSSVLIFTVTNKE